MITIRTILVPTDFSPGSLQSTRYSLEFARRFEASVELLHVIEDPVIYLPMFESQPLPSREEFEEYAKTRLENWILPEDRGNVTVRYHWRHGRPSHAIVQVAKELDADLIIMGSHGHGNPVTFLMGSHAERVTRTAPCPVLTVRPEGHQFVSE